MAVFSSECRRNHEAQVTLVAWLQRFLRIKDDGVHVLGQPRTGVRIRSMEKPFDTCPCIPANKNKTNNSSAHRVIIVELFAIFGAQNNFACHERKSELIVYVQGRTGNGKWILPLLWTGTC